MEEQEMNEKVKDWKEDGTILDQVEKNKSKAEDLLNDKSKMEKFLERLERKLAKIPLAGKYLGDVPILILLVKDYINKDYAEIPIGTIIAVISALIYVLSPIDLIPDIIPVFGILDDAAVVATVYKLVHDDIEEYKVWRATNKK